MSKVYTVKIRKCVAQEAKLSALWWPRGVNWGVGRETSEGGDIYIHMADPHCCTAEIDIVKELYNNKKRMLDL